jgi:hypothetical protein
MWVGDRADEANARGTVATTITFGEGWDIPVAELEAVKKYGWQVARPDAYMEIFHKEWCLSLRPPLAWELELTEGCLRSVPDFVNRHQQDDITKEEFLVPVASRELKRVLSWVVDGYETSREPPSRQKAWKQCKAVVKALEPIDWQGKVACDQERNGKGDRQGNGHSPDTISGDGAESL